VHYPRGLAMYGFPTHDLSTVGLSYGLVTEADAEHRDPFGGLLYDPKRDPGLVRGTWAGRDDYPVWMKRGHLLGREFVVAPDDDLGFELPEVLHEVVREGIVIVYYQNPHKPQDCSKEQTERQGREPGDRTAPSPAEESVNTLRVPCQHLPRRTASTSVRLP